MNAIHEPLTLPNGQVLPNRIMKSALSEALGDKRNPPDDRLAQLYQTGSQGGSSRTAAAGHASGNTGATPGP